MIVGPHRLGILAAAGAGGSTKTYAQTVLDTNPYGYWRLDETSGTTAVDETANNNDATYIGSPTLGLSPLINDGTSVGMDGVDDSIDTGIVTVPLSWSVAIWFRTPSTLPNRNMRIACMDSSGGQATFLLWYHDTSGAIKMNATNQAGSYLSGGGTSIISSPQTDTRYFCVLTFDDNDKGLRGYRDGSHIATQSGDSALNDLGESLVFGSESDQTGDFWEGRLDEPAWWQRVLTLTEISELYNAGTA